MNGPSLDSITTGDARVLTLNIPDESIDCIFTDPVYENVDDYLWLGQQAARILRPDSALLAWVKTSLHDECKAALSSSGLRYRWTLYYACSAKSAKPVDGGIFPCVTPCLFFSKGKYKADPHINDYYFSPYSAKRVFEWNKGGGVVEKWLASFSKPGDVVFDPFCGEGSVEMACKRLGRHYVAFEINPERAEKARRHVERMPVMLPFESMEQMSL